MSNYTFEHSQNEQKSADDYAREAEERRLAHEARLNESAAKQRAESAEIEARAHAEKVAELSAQHDEFRKSLPPQKA